MTYAVLNAISVITIVVLQNETLMAYIHCSRLHLCVQCVIFFIVDNIYQTTAILFTVPTLNNSFQWLFSSYIAPRPTRLLIKTLKSTFSVISLIAFTSVRFLQSVLLVGFKALQHFITTLIDDLFGNHKEMQN